MIESNNDFFDTLLYKDGGFVNLERHIERFLATCQFLKLRPVIRGDSPDIWYKKLEKQFSSNLQRIRIDFKIQTAYITPTVHNTSYVFNPIKKLYLPDYSSGKGIIYPNSRLNYKFTYNPARKLATSLEKGSDILIINSQGNICETTRTNIIVENDQHYFTPPLSDGLLAGTRRAQILSSGLNINGQTYPVITRSIAFNEFLELIKNNARIILVNALATYELSELSGVFSNCLIFR